jgi:flagella basal body P-ring formation protein FlgA
MTAALALLLAFAAGPALAGVEPVRAIRAQTVLEAADLTESAEAVPGGVATIEAAAGREAKVTLYPGRPILASQIGPPAIVARNQIVRMVFLRGPLAIEADGRALDRGGAGDLVRVMNLGSKQIVTGAVAADGSVEVGR